MRQGRGSNGPELHEGEVLGSVAEISRTSYKSFSPLPAPNYYVRMYSLLLHIVTLCILMH